MALAPALRRRPALEELGLGDNPLGDEGIAALVAPPPPPAGAKPPPTGVLTKLKMLYLWETQITDAGCVSLVAALDGGVLPALQTLDISDTPADYTDGAARDALEARFRYNDSECSDDSGEEWYGVVP